MSASAHRPSLLDLIPQLPYKDLWSMVEYHTSISREAAEEIRTRRKSGMLPFIEGTTSPAPMLERQNGIYLMLSRELRRVGAEAVFPYSQVSGGWVVYLTGDDNILLAEKVVRTRDMINQDAKEFGSCRIFAFPVDRDYVGIKLHFDRGLRCVYPLE